MEKEIRTWMSPNIGKEMRLIKYGTSGTPVVAFPGNGGTAEDWENHNVLDAIRVQLEEGYNTLYCLDSIDNESFLNKEVDPPVRITRQKQYEMYLLDEVWPIVTKESTQDFIIAMGIHLGAYQVINLSLRHPSKVNKAISIMGNYDIRPYLDDYFEEAAYFQNPAEYFPNLQNDRILSEIRDIDFRICISPNSVQYDSNQRFSNLLNNKGITHEWDNQLQSGDDDWAGWAKMIANHIP